MSKHTAPGNHINRLRSEAGFSLVEMLIALAIIALIMGLVAPRVVGYLGRAKSQSAEIQIEHIKGALNLFLLDMGRYPTSEEGLDALMDAPLGSSKWAGPYIDDEAVPLDPWERSYRYEVVNEGLSVRVYTLGADDSEGGSGENADIG